jgi:hypothetical protein
MGRHTQLIRLGVDDFGVYLVGPPFAAGPYGTPLLFRGTFEQCQEFRVEFAAGRVVDPEFLASEDV